MQQFNPDPANDIWVKYNFGAGFEGNLGWYPNGGDNGYSVISLAGGANFHSVGFNIGTGSAPVAEFLYELLDNNAVVLAGSVSGASSYLGFSGGGFDTIRIRDSEFGGGTVTDGSQQAMAFDSIETFSPTAAVPEPASIAMLVTGALGLMLARRRCRQIAT